MGKKWKIILVVSLLANLSIVYVAFKALDYRSHVNYFLDKYSHFVAEFSERSEYEKDNARLAAENPTGKRVIFIGAQITRGWNLAEFFSEYEPINRGISGQKLGGLLLRFRPDVVELKPKAVVIEFSSYNFRSESSIEEMEDYIASLADMSRIQNISPILTTVVPVRRDFESETESPYIIQDSIRVFNRWLIEYCHNNGIAYVDFAESVSDSQGYLLPENSAGQILLSREGYDKISIATLKILRSIIN